MPKWTDAQQDAIDARGGNILVSAAAGSGKTAVLIERVSKCITDPGHPVDIDRLLIVTFTNAAAAEMRSRLSVRLRQILAADPGNANAKRQLSLLSGADICTIDAFCLKLVRENFFSLNLAADFRLLDENENDRLFEEAIDTVLTEFYEEADPEFLHLTEAFTTPDKDRDLFGLIKELMRFMNAQAFPFDWLEQAVAAYDPAVPLMDSPWYPVLKRQVEEMLETAAALVKQSAGQLPPEPAYDKYAEMLADDRQLIAHLKSLLHSGWDAFMKQGFPVAFANMPRVRKDIDPEVKAVLAANRDIYKTIITKDIKTFLVSDSADYAQDTADLYPIYRALLRVVQAVERLVREKKDELGGYAFSDIEHFAIDLLMEKAADGTVQATALGRQLQGRYAEILVDEYQDTNEAQDRLFAFLSNGGNRFMVGDVKQSIYRFRLARPELFMEKYEQYSLTDSTEQRIDLHKNFRSRSQVLDSANFIFRQIMGTDLGGIAYDKAAALYPGAVFPEGNKESFLPAEVLLVEKDSEELEDLMEGKDARELEALAISHRIKEIVGKELVLDKETKEYRPAKYGDIVILLRTASGWSETFTEVLSAHGIPVYAASKTGYFSALEVVTILNYLQVCDNPLQDIPLTGVLRSPLVGCTTQELAVLREKHPKGMLYDSVLNFLEEYEGQERTLYHKLHGFIVLLNEMRDFAVYTPVHELILEILRRTGYGNYAKALPNGAQRSANLAMLVEKAMDYEKTSYRGLFNFVRYIEHLQKYEVDYGEVNLSGAGEGSVEIMTIHKSKGLEFPIVILAGMGKQFNMQDLNARLLIHPDYGLGADAILPDRRMIVSTLYKQVIRRKLLEETLGEEIRVLYVALTRAKEKLIMTGTIGNLEKRLLSLYRFRENDQELLPAETRLNGKTYWDYVLPALARHRCMDQLFEEFGLQPSHDNLLYDNPAEFQVKRITARTLTEAEVVEQAAGQMEDDILDNWDCEKIVDPEIRVELEKRFGFVYPYEYRKDIPVKVSVSDLKKKSYHEDSDIEEAVYFEPDIVPLVPRFIEEKKETEEAFTGSARGTAYHRVMECLEYNKTDSAQQLKEQINALVQSKKMSEAEAECIRISDIQFFVNGALGQRMKVAALSGLLFREQPFVISRSAAEIDEAWDPKERVLVQGIIDAYFLEGDEIVLVDYKTDRVRRGEEQKLVDLYHTQLEDYAQALHRMTGRRVKEKYIYSFTLKKEILLG